MIKFKLILFEKSLQTTFNVFSIFFKSRPSLLSLWILSEAYELIMQKIIG